MARLTDLRVNDFDELRESWTADGWDADYRQLERGAFRGRLLSSELGPWSIYRGLWTPRFHHRGLQPKGTMSLGVTLFQQGVGRFAGARMGPDQHVVQAGDMDFDLISAQVWEAAVFQLPRIDVARQVAAVTQRDPELLLGRQCLVTLPPQTGARLRTACLAYFDLVERSLESGKEGFPLRAMADDLVSLAIRAFAAALLDPAAKPPPSRRREIVRKTEELVMSSISTRWTIPGVCREVGVSERALRYAFRDLVGMSPAAYLKAQRLNGARRLLRLADPSETTVKQVAYDCGFWHLGQFSCDYKAQFGELPSETLAPQERKVPR